jgi:hypothetical protein
VAVDGDEEFYSQDLVGLTVVLSPYHPAANLSPESNDDSSEFGDAASAEGSSTESGDAARADGSPVHAGVTPHAACNVEAASSPAGNDAQELHALGEHGGLEEEGMELWDLGVVTDVYDGTGTHGVIRVQFSAGLVIGGGGSLSRSEGMREADVESGARPSGTRESGLLPFARDVVPEVDLEAGIMIVDPPLGWLEMYLTPKKKKVRRRIKKRKSPRTPPVKVVSPAEMAQRS